MSRIFDALEKVAADRATLHEEPPDAGERAPERSSGTPTRRNRFMVGIVVGFVVVAATIPRLLERQQRSAPLTPPAGESPTVPNDTPSGASVADAEWGPPAQPTLESGDSIAPPARRSTFSVQVGAFKNRDNAVLLQAQLARRHHPATIHAARAEAASWAVQVGHYPDRRAAEAARAALAREGFAGFVVPGENEGTARPSFPTGK